MQNPGDARVLKKIACPNPRCGHAYMIEVTNLGRLARCRHCGIRFITTLRADGSHAVETLSDDEPAPLGAERTEDETLPEVVPASPGQRQDSRQQASNAFPQRSHAGSPAGDHASSSAAPTGSGRRQTDQDAEPPPGAASVNHSGRADERTWVDGSRSANVVLPRRIGRFEIVRRLGSGGFGYVYEAFDPHLERKVALKVPRDTTLAKRKALARFLREPKAAAVLRHPNIVPVYDAGEHDGRYFIAWAYIEGETLARRLRSQRFDTRQSVELVRRLAEGLHHAHSQGVVHRDVKPSNIMIDQNGEPLLMDFGLARVDHAATKLTGDGAVLGTPAYIAPEQIDRAYGEVSPKSDQYSLGVLLYELLTGERPFQGSLADVFHAVLHQSPRPPRQVCRQIPRDLEAIVLKAMSKRPEDRYDDCEQLANDLRRYSAGQAVLARRETLHERLARWATHRPVAASVTVAAFVTLLGLLAFTTWRWQAAEAALRQLQQTPAQKAASPEARR